MARVAKTGSRKNYGEGKPTAYWGEGRGSEPDRYGFSVPATDRTSKQVHVELSEFDLRRLIEEWRGLAKGHDTFVHELPNVGIGVEA
jgi:hypothetical protein